MVISRPLHDLLGSPRTHSLASEAAIGAVGPQHEGGDGHSPISFTELVIGFDLQHRGPTTSRIRAHFVLEGRPPWAPADSSDLEERYVQPHPTCPDIRADETPTPGTSSAARAHAICRECARLAARACVETGAAAAGRFGIPALNTPARSGGVASWGEGLLSVPGVSVRRTRGYEEEL
jgi:hypothetical protein